MDGPQGPSLANEHWIVWAKPAIFIWALDLMVQGADWTVYLTASAVVAYASVSVFGRATVKDAVGVRGCTVPSFSGTA